MKFYLAGGTEGGSAEAIIKSGAKRVLVSFVRSKELKRFQQKAKDHSEGKDISRRKKKK